MGKHTSPSMDGNVGSDWNGLDSGNHPRWRMNELWIEEQHLEENALAVKTSSKGWLSDEEVGIVSQPVEVEPMDARFIVSVEPLKDTHGSRNLLDCVIQVESKRKKGKGRGKGTIHKRSDHVITQLRFYERLDQR
ncbi:hypothetical protein V6N11_017853 [Hibiscus sabdariffa]|uniref:Uncharacterized protein n=1 Tax=Hibiscus sabdariffa TaxID=183260 RepID=A0ABR2T659_9ROSI